MCIRDRPKNDQLLHENIEQYRRTVVRGDDQRMFNEFERALQTYMRIRAEILDPTMVSDPARVAAKIKSDLRPAFYVGRDVLANMVAANKQQADDSAVSIQRAVDKAEVGMLVSLGLAIAAAIICGILLMRAIVNPMSSIVKTLESTGGGDLTRRLTLARKDEFNAIESGFNGMVDELTGLVGKTQRSAVHPDGI